MEVMQSSKVKEQLDIIWRPHPVAPSADCQYKVQEWKSGQTVREVLIANGIDQHQPISIVLDDRLLTVEEWDTVCPQPNQIINVKAEVAGGGGGGGGSQVLQVVAMIALVVAVVVLQQYELLPLIGGLSASASAGVYIAVGSLVINGIAAAVQSNSMSMGDIGGMGGAYSQASPTYSLTGGSNRQRPYESMPVIMGQHRFFPDAAIKPYTQYIGEDQYLYQAFHLGLSSATFSNYKIGTTDITDFSDYTWSYPDADGKINKFPGNVDTIAGASLEQSAGWITRTTSPNTDNIGIDIEGTLYYANDSGGLSSTSVEIEIEYKATSSGTWIQPTTLTAQGNGFSIGDYQTYSAYVSQGYDNYDGEGNWTGWVDTSYYETRTHWVAGSGNTLILSGASQAPRRVTVFLDVTPGEYDVRVRRTTADSTNSRLQNKTNWSSLKSYQTDTASYVGQNRIGLTIRASEQLNGVIQQLSVTASAKANYYNGSVWVFGETSNPAHWFMDFALGRKDKNGKLLYGIGLPTSQIDYVGLAAWASFCTTEGLTFNSVLDGQQTAADVLNGIARAGFASPSWSTGKLGAVWDKRNASPVAAFGMSNIIKGSFQVSYITEQLAEEIVVRYVNPNKDWAQDEVRVNVPGVTTPTRTSSIDLWGCTSTTMAGKFANYIAAQQYYRTRRITWDCDFEGFICSRGDVVILSHDLTQWGYSGRIVSGTENYEAMTAELEVDRVLDRSGSSDYLMVKRPDGNMYTYTATPSATDSNIINLTNVGPGSTNYALYSQALNSWTKSGCTVSSDIIANPINGSNDADKVVVNNGVSAAYIYENITKPSASSLTMTYSFYLKAGEFNTNRLYLHDLSSTANRIDVYFNAGTGTVFSSARAGTFTNLTSGMIDKGNGWYRCWATFTTGSEATVRARNYVHQNGSGAALGDGAKGIYSFGHQFESLAYPTGYIATTTTIQSRSSNEVLQDGYLPLDHLWMYAPLATPGKKVKILSVQPQSESRVQIIATDEYPEFYAAWDGTWEEPAASTLLPKPEIPVIENLLISEQLAIVGTGRIVTRVNISWTQKTSQCERVDITYKLGADAVKTVSVYNGNSVNIDFDGYGTLTATAFPINGVYSGKAITATKEVYGKTLPPSDVANFTATIVDKSIELKWDACLDIDLQNYEVRDSNIGWGTGGAIFVGLATKTVVEPVIPGVSKTWYVKAIDTSGNYSANVTSVTFTAEALPNVTNITQFFTDTSLTAATLTLDWDEANAQYGTDAYVVSWGSEVKSVKASTITVPADWLGDRTYNIKTRDINGNLSSGTEIIVTKFAPNPVTNVRTQVIDNNVLLYWDFQVKTSLPIQHVLIKKGATWETAETIGTKDGGFTTLQETLAGIYTYWIAVVDTDNNMSTPVSVSTEVAEPPDFVFHGDFNSDFSGTKSSAFLEDGGVIVPVNTTETWSSHFTSRSWTSPQSQISAGFPIYIQPANGSGYYEETFDYGTILGSSKINVSYTGDQISGTTTIYSTISVSVNGSTWIDYAGTTSAYATNFRYVKVKLTVTESTGIGLYRFTSLYVRLDAKLKNDAGTVSCLSTDPSGTIVNFNKEFVDVDSITVSPNGTTLISAVYNFQDSSLSGTYSVTSNVCTVNVTGHDLIQGQNVRLGFSSGNGINGVYTVASVINANSYTVAMTVANTSGNVLTYPEGFRLYLFNSSGTRVSGTASWSSKGY